MNSSRMDQGAAFVLTPTDMAYLVSGRGMTYISLRSSLEREERTRFWGQKEGAHAFSGEAEEGFHVVGHAADEGCEGRFGEVECLEVAGDVFAPGIQEGAFGEGTHAFFDVPLEGGGDFFDGAFYGFVEEFLCDEEADLFFVDRFYFNAWRDFPVVPDGEVDIAFDEAGPELFIRGFQNAECDARVLVPNFFRMGGRRVLPRT